MIMSPQPQFALLSHKTRNIGDDIQSVAASRFLPRVDQFVERDLLASYAPEQATKLICHGWFGTKPQNFGFGPGVDPLLLSMHISERSNFDKGGDAVAFATVLRSVPELKAELSRFGPVGARDLATLRLLRELGIEGYYSGCLTLTLERDPLLQRGGEIVACDVPDEIFARLREISNGPIRIIRHAIEPSHDERQRLAEAERLLGIYQTAALVVTTRLHCALPCVAYGTPVLFLVHDFEAERFDGLLDLMQTVALREAGNLRRENLKVSLEQQQAHHDLRHQLIARVTTFIAKQSDVIGRPGDLARTSRALTTYYERQASGLRDQLAEVRTELAALQQSRSWRVTSPLRAVRRWLDRT